MAESNKGWGWPGSSKKAHYFINGRSLCGKWMYFGALPENQKTGPKAGPDDCAACHKKALKLLANNPQQPDDQNVKGESP